MRNLSANEKLEAIHRVHKGESKASVARNIGVPESTLRGWCKNEGKISYLSRQSSPDTDESLESKLKKPKLDEGSTQPYNLSLKPSVSALPEPKPDQISGNVETLRSSQEDPNINDRERNRAELARLSVEYGLNRPEIYSPSLNASASNLADITTNIGLLAQWNALLMQQQHKLQNTPKNLADLPSASTNHTGLLTTVDQEKNKVAITDKLSLQEYMGYWLKSQQSSLAVNNVPATLVNSASTSKMNNTATSSSSCFPSTTSTISNVSLDQIFMHNWYKQIAAYQQQSLKQEEKPILYQQLTKEAHSRQSVTPPKVSPEPVIDQQNAENLSIYDESQKQRSKSTSSSKIRSVLDNLLCNNINVSVTQKDESSLSQKEAVEHGEQFLKWMEACSDPSVTAMQIMQFRTLLNNIKSGADKKNGEQQNKTKCKRK